VLAKKSLVISALIVMTPASGRMIDGSVVISAANVADFAPSPEAVRSVTAELRSKGFKIGPLVGISFSVEGTVRAFEEFFGTQIQLGKDGAYEFVTKRKTHGHELSKEDLPGALRKYVTAVAFPLPPDFGPTEFHP
jgi:hypothetical protein